MPRCCSWSVVGILLLASSASATTFQCQAGDSLCLIVSIRAANLAGGANTILLAPGTYPLYAADNFTDGPNGLPAVSSTLVIDGGAGAVIQGMKARFRLLAVSATGHLTLRHLTVSNGPRDPLLDIPLAECGGGVFNAGVLTVVDSTFSHDDTAGLGGGLCNNGTATITDSVFADNRTGAIYNTGTLTLRRTWVARNLNTGPSGVLSMSGTVTIRDSIFDDNDAMFDAGGLAVYGGSADIAGSTFTTNSSQGAGALYVGAPASVTITQSALIANTDQVGGAGIRNFGTVAVSDTTIANNVTDGIFGSAYVALMNAGTVTLTNVTFANNNARFPGSAFTTVVQTAPSGKTTVQNTIFGHVPGEFVQECQGTLISRGSNIFGNLAGCAVTLQAEDIVGDAGLGAFVDDGTAGGQYYPLLSTSPAIDHANKMACEKTDQIGHPRRNRCDIGAIEFPKRAMPDQMTERVIGPLTLTR
jgi:hypothetical protein